MLLILSETTDISTDRVILWLRKMGYQNIIRINEDDRIEIKRVEISNDKGECVIKLYQKDIDLDKVDFFWYRRGDFFPEDLQNYEPNLRKFLSKEWTIIRNYLHYKLGSKKCLGNIFKSLISKLECLEIAKKAGFSIPQTLISSHSKILDQKDRLNSSITKPISDIMPICYQGNNLNLLTREIPLNFKFESPFIFPSLIQQKIDKWVELRVFVLKNKVFPMAIFSQSNKKTSMDFRDYDWENMNRVVPYKLEIEIENRIMTFMQMTGIDSGSLDLIITPSKEVVFLEINPGGVIEMVSDPCNYYIEEFIAQYIYKQLNEN